MKLRGVGADLERIGDVPVGQAAGEERQDLPLPRGERPGGGDRARFGRGAQRSEPVLDDDEDSTDDVEDRDSE